MELIELSRLTQNEDNPRYITEDDFRALLASIATFPQMLFHYRPIIIDEAVNVLGGNMRLLALQRIAEMSDGELRSLIASREDKTEGEREALMQFWTDWRKEPTAPILRSEDLSEEQKLELIAKDNINNGSWDSGKLAAKWDMQQLKSWGVAKWVIDHDDRVAAKGGYTEVEGDNYESVEAGPNTDEPTDTKLGDVFQLGRHRLICGDSTKAEYINALCDGAMMDLLLTDPPYGVDYKGGANPREGIANDNLHDEELQGFLQLAIGNAVNNLRDGGSYYIWYAAIRAYEFISCVRSIPELKPRIDLVWVKSHFTLSHQGYQPRTEPCLYGFKKGSTPPYFTPRRDISNVLEAKKPQSSPLHPTMKPIDLFGQLIQNSTRDDENVLDVFGGSGTTLIACEQLNRTCYMSEFSPHYVDVIVKRWEDLTGQKAVKLYNINDGK